MYCVNKVQLGLASLFPVLQNCKSKFAFFENYIIGYYVRIGNQMKPGLASLFPVLQNCKSKFASQIILFNPKHENKFSVSLFTKNCNFWSDVETPGIEPGSKQATKIVSTCLFSDWF